MNTTLTCNISISKKLRNILNGGNIQIILSTDDLINGVGKGVLTINSESEIPNDDICNILDKETGIIIKPLNVNNELKTFTPIGNLFNQSDSKQPNKIIKKIATSDVDRKVAHSIKSKSQIDEETPKEFIQCKNPSFKAYVSSMQELLEAISNAKNKKSDIVIPPDATTRQKAVLEERINLAQAIDTSAWIVNDKFSSISINDLGIELRLNNPFNLNRISSKKLADSSQLIELINNGTIKLISPNDVEKFNESLIKQQNFNTGLEVFGKVDDAIESLENAESIAMIDEKTNNNDYIPIEDYDNEDITDKDTKFITNTERISNHIQERNIVRQAQQAQQTQQAQQARYVRKEAQEEQLETKKRPEWTSFSGNVRKTSHGSDNSISNTGESLKQQRLKGFRRPN